MKYSKYDNELTVKYILPEKIIICENADNPEAVFEDTVRQPFLGDISVCTMKKGSNILLDFGKEIAGGVDITTHRCTGKKPLLRITFGESVMESLSDIGVNNSTNDHCVRDSIVEAGQYSNFRVGQTGFRFVRVECIDGEIEISGIRGAYEFRDIPYRGSFECSDGLLTRIWYTGAHTVHLNMQNYLWDGVKRDRLVWIGDMHAEVAGVSCIFGDHSIVNKSLSLIKDITPENSWMNTIPAYSFWWLIIRYEWYLKTGDIKPLINDREYIISLIKYISSCIKEDGSDDFGKCMGSSNNDFPYASYFIDWESYKTEDSKAGFFAVLLMALDASRRICKLIDAPDAEGLCRKTDAIIRKMKFNLPGNRQMASLGALSGLFDADVVNNEVLSKEPVCDISAYMGYYTLLAKAKAGDFKGAVDIIRSYWGRMIELGATSFWESFDYVASEGATGIDKIVPEGGKDAHLVGGEFCYSGYRRSLCHGWACGPTPFISGHILGVSPAEPGFKKVYIKPELGGLDYVKGRYPTPYGDIEIFAENNNGKVNCDIRVPEEIEIIK